jgi:peroxiredoxin
LQRDLKSIEKAGIQVVGVSYDDTKVLKTFSDRMKITSRSYPTPRAR